MQFCQGPACTVGFTPAPTAPQQRFCSNACQMRAWRRAHGSYHHDRGRPCKGCHARRAEPRDSYCIRCQLDGTAPLLEDVDDAA